MKRSRLWLVAVIVLVVLAGWLFSRGDNVKPTPKLEVDIPHRMRPKEYRRMVRRRVLPAPMPTETKRLVARPRDPLLAALPGGPGSTAVVFEANALRNSPVGKLLLDCMGRLSGRFDGADGGTPLDKIRKRFGIDPLEDVDRIAITPHGLIVTGNFQNAHWNAIPGTGTPEPYGNEANLYPMSQPMLDGGTSSAGVVATWNHQLLFLGDTQADAQAAIDRIEGRAPADPPLNENQTYGEIYGVISPSDFMSTFGPGPDSDPRQSLLGKLMTTAQKIELHVDARSDVGVDANVVGANADQMDDLGKSIAGALSAARMEAQSEDDDTLAQFLDFAKVDPGIGKFQLDLALPLSWLQQKLAWCEDPSLPLPEDLAAEQQIREAATPLPMDPDAGVDQ